MSIRKTGLWSTVAVLILALGMQPAMGNRPTGEQISGVVSAVHKDGMIVVAGRPLHVKSDSPASHALASLSPGSTVTVMLDGPASKSSSQVVGIAVRQGETRSDN